MVNLQTAGCAAATAAAAWLLRSCSFSTWVCVVLVPLSVYAVVADRTKATKLHNKICLVTGAGSGLGKALAVEASRRGCKTVILVARTKAALEACAEECRRVASYPGFSPAVEVCDVSKPDDVRRLAARVAKDHGALDVLVNNAGAGEWKHVEDTTPEEAVQMMAVPYQAAFALTSCFVPGMAAARTGHVLNVTSAAADSAFRGAVGYASARWAVKGLTKSLYWDLKELDIGVTLLDPAELGGTEYFADAPGKAGSASRAMIPSLFQLIDRLGLNFTTTQCAEAALSGVERGCSVVMCPWYLLPPVKLLNDWVPWYVELLSSLGPAGLRKTAKPKPAE